MDAPKPHIAEKAVIPTKKSSPSLTKNTMIGALVMLLLALAILTAMYLMDDTIKSSEDLEKYFGIMPLTVIPEGKIEGEKILEEQTAESTQPQKRRKKKSKRR
jgi:capsular polysaccharide biosynthesis protein